MSSTSFQVVYDGPALDGSTIDVRDLAPALLSFGEAIEQANQTLNGGKASVSLRVNASFKSGCFGIDFSVSQGLIAQLNALFSEPGVVSAKELAENIGFVVGVIGAPVSGLLYVLRWLKNRQINKVVLLENGKVRIEVDGDALVTEQHTIALYRNYRLRMSLEAAITKQLDKEGFESIAFSSNPKDGFFVITKQERSYFAAPVSQAELLADDTVTANLQLVSISFKGDNKWRFSDGSNPFYASVLDQSFLQKVQSGDANFTAGDILKVRLRKRQWLESDQMKSEHEVLEVIQHRRGMAQIPMSFEDSKPPEKT